MRPRISETLRHALLKACGRLPRRPLEADEPDELRPSSLVELMRARCSACPGQSGLSPLMDGEDALLARLGLIHGAENTLDLQYYIWNNDLTGSLLTLFCLQAADRGVQVRLLIDDLGSKPDDLLLRALDSHPNIDVRLYNPVAWRRLRWFGLLLGAFRLNRRMHNKSLTADGVATILGGRNIGDEYFGANRHVDFHDLDVLCIGEVVPEVAASFELYWQHKLSLPVDAFYQRRLPPDALEDLRAQILRRLEGEYGADYLASVSRRLDAAPSQQAALHFYWGVAQLLYDHPDKTLDKPQAVTLTQQLSPLMADSRHHLDIMSPYFVPGLKGMLWLRERARSGVQIRILTNSLAATDVTAVHAGYARYRWMLLQAGVQLFELRPDPSQHIERKKWLGRSRSSLHAKTFLLDRRFVFVGSLNLDPRSVEINTEIGVLFDNPALAALLGERFEATISRESYALSRRKTGLLWRDVSGVRNWKKEPNTTFRQRLWVRLLQFLPIESQL
ncbi:phospholipase D family protein [Chitinilyticum aquatile]|uniref:phospholipase D family protein n=1 Tax=Chitinilyticum aquatile TaxID=362520 RepID=UPI0003F8084D|nr:phospholipase D family protein [Chitinilyticum aquatile]